MGTVQSIDRALAILSEAALRPGGLSDLARRVDLPTSTASRVLATLAEAGALTRDDDGAYQIGPAIVAMARSAGAVPAAPPLESAARRHLGDLADATGEAAGLCVPIGDDIHTIAQLDAPKSVQAQDWTGSTWPAHRGGSGLVMLSTFDDEDLTSYLDRQGISDRAAARIRKRVRRATVDGWCWSHGDYTDELSSVAAPVTDRRGRAVAALYVYGPSYRFPGDAAPELEGLVVDHASQLSDTIGASTWP